MTVKELKLLLRQWFNKIGYTLYAVRPILFNCYACSIVLFKIHRLTQLTAQTLNCTDMCFRSVLDTHSLAQA